VQFFQPMILKQARRKAEIRIARWTAEEKDLRVTSNERLRVVLRLLNYPAWRVSERQGSDAAARNELSGQMIFHSSRTQPHHGKVCRSRIELGQRHSCWGC